MFSIPEAWQCRATHWPNVYCSECGWLAENEWVSLQKFGERRLHIKTEVLPPEKDSGEEGLTALLVIQIWEE